MNIGIVNCPELGITENNIKQHSIYLLPDDSYTDFDFYVLVDSKEARERIRFLKKLHDYITTDNVNKRNKLLNSLDENDPCLKILIEKYPYRLFVVIDKDNWKVNNGKTPLDNDFPWNNYNSQFIKKRICWIGKEELSNAFSESNQDVLEIRQVNAQNEAQRNNILADNNKFRWQERAKLWLYYKWVEHLMDIKGINEIHNELGIGIDREVKQFVPLTVYPSRGIRRSRNFIIQSQKKIIFQKRVDDKQNNKYMIAFSRHASPVLFGKNWQFFKSYIYSEGLSGVQFQLPMLLNISAKDFSAYFCSSVYPVCL